MRCANRPHFSLLQGAQQLCLQIEREFANLVEEYRASLGGNQQAVLGAVGAGVCAFHVAEQFALNERRHQRAAIDRQKRLLRIRTKSMNGPRH